MFAETNKYVIKILEYFSFSLKQYRRKYESFLNHELLAGSSHFQVFPIIYSCDKKYFLERKVKRIIPAAALPKRTPFISR